MIFCAKCGVEMTCMKTGCGVDFGNGHVYAGDRFTCRICGANVVHTNSQPYFDKDYASRDEYIRARGVEEPSKKTTRNLLIEGEGR